MSGRDLRVPGEVRLPRLYGFQRGHGVTAALHFHGGEVGRIRLAELLVCRIQHGVTGLEVRHHIGPGANRLKVERAGFRVAALRKDVLREDVAA